MVSVKICLLVNEIIFILSDNYFKTVFSWLSLTRLFASITSGTWRFFEHRYFTSVATCLGCGGIFKIRLYCRFTTMSLTVKDF